MDKKRIPNELSAQFDTTEGRRKLVELYGDSDTMFSGENADGETVMVSIDTENGIVLNTYQHNGWVRVNYYNKDGVAEGESFDGRWKENAQ